MSVFKEFQRYDGFRNISKVLRCCASQGSSGDRKSGPGTAFALQRVLQTFVNIQGPTCWTFWMLLRILVFWWHNRLHMMTAIKAYLTSFPLIYTVYLNDSLGLSARGVACPTSNVKAARSTTCVLSLLFWPFNLPYSRPCKGARKEPMHDDSSTVTVQQLVQSSDSNS